MIKATKTTAAKTATISPLTEKKRSFFFRFKEFFFSLPLFLALRVLKGGQKKWSVISLTSWFSMIGIMLGVGSLIVVMSIMNGFRIELIDRILGISSHVQIYENQGGLLDQRAVATFLDLPGVVTVTGVNESQGVLVKDGTASALLVRSLSGRDIVKRTIFAHSMTNGVGWNNFDNSNGVVVGAGMSNQHNVEIGDTITLVPPRLTNNKGHWLPNPKDYKVVGIFHIGMNDYDSNIIFMPPALAYNFMNQPPNKIQKIEIMLQKPSDSRLFLKDLKPRLASNQIALDWQNTNAPLVSSLKVESNVMFLILTMIILVAAFNVISGQTMLVKEKKSTIAILRATGGSRSLVLAVFLIAGSSLGIIGTLLGTVAGVLIAANAEAIRQTLQRLSGTPLFSPEVYYLTQLPSKILWSDVVMITSLALALSVLSALGPALMASRLPPATILRHE